jgi:hypothetical protein
MVSGWTVPVRLLLWLCTLVPAFSGSMMRPDFSVYHTTSAILERLGRLSELHPGLVDAWPLLPAAAGAPAPLAVRLTLGEPAVARGANGSATARVPEKLGGDVVGDDGRARTRVLIVAGEHGRELISAELGLHLVETLVAGTRALPCTRAAWSLTRTSAGAASQAWSPRHAWCERMRCVAARAF